MTGLLNDDEFKKLWDSAGGKKDFEPVKVGTYHAEISGVKFDEGTNEKAPVVTWEATITDLTSGFANRKIWQRNQVTEKGLYFLRQNMDILGLGMVTTITEMIASLEKALGSRVSIKVKQREYNGKTYNDFEMLELISGGQADTDNLPF